MTTKIDPTAYENRAFSQNMAWRSRLQKPPGVWDQTTRATQDRINSLIPEAVHKTVTAVMKRLTQTLMSGSGWIAGKPLTFGTLYEREEAVHSRILTYKRTASVEGGVAGAGGFVLAAVDLPALMAIKLKLLFEICALYGHDSRDPVERLYILRIFQLAFSSARNRPQALAALEATLPRLGAEASPTEIDWRQFQLEYRDYIDLAKLAQLLPVIGAPVGAVANWRLTSHLAKTAIQAYRLRWFNEADPL
jgi:hypothetical protein